MFILLLTIFTERGTGATITSVPGFESQNACMVAGSAWSKAKTISKPYSPITLRAVCVRAK